MRKRVYRLRRRRASIDFRAWSMSLLPNFPAASSVHSWPIASHIWLWPPYTNSIPWFSSPCFLIRIRRDINVSSFLQQSRRIAYPSHTHIPSVKTQHGSVDSIKDYNNWWNVQPGLTGSLSCLWEGRRDSRKAELFSVSLLPVIKKQSHTEWILLYSPTIRNWYESPFI